MTLTLESLLGRGYFPKELPPPFSTTSFGRFAAARRGKPIGFDTGNERFRFSKPELFNLARAGSFRRELAVLNPIHFATLAEFVVSNWDVLKNRAFSPLSLTVPTLDSSDRAISRQNNLEALPVKRAQVRSHGRYLLKADVSRFYASIYTHTLAWALDGKAAAKAKDRDPNSLGNKLDRLVGSCQDRQTNGIPVGPDTSLLFSELLLASVDRKLARRRLTGFRYMDDYELVFEDEARALETRSLLQEALLEFELHLSAEKTAIIPLPDKLEEGWVAKLSQFHLNPESPAFRKHLIRFFDRAFELSRESPKDGVLKYAAGRLLKLPVNESDQELAEDLLMQCAQVEAGTLSLVLAALLKSPQSQKARAKKRGAMLLSLIRNHAAQKHSSEVAWALWACIVLRIPLSKGATQMVVEMEDSVCALLALHARRLGLVADSSTFAALREACTGAALYGNRWLLAYEANIQGWFQFRGAQDYVAADANFSRLKNGGVSFYDKTRTTLPASTSREALNDVIEKYMSRLRADYGGANESLDEDSDESEDGEFDPASLI